MIPQLILNVDDREINRYIRTRILEHAGYRVIEACDGSSALELYRAKQPHLVLLDMNLPDVNGLEVCRSILAESGDAGIIVVHISATSTETLDQVQGLDNGAHAYLTEPVEPAFLVATVRSLLALRSKVKPASPPPKPIPAAAPKGRQMIANERNAGATTLVESRRATNAYGLTAREREVLDLIATGQSTKEIARSLGIAFRTAACHRNRILAKFGARNTAEVIRMAVSADMVTL